MGISPALPLPVLVAMGLMTVGMRAHDSTEVAIERITGELATRPEEPRLYLDRARLQLEHGDWKACLEDLDRAGHRANSDLQLDHLRGRAFALGGKWKEAASMLESHLSGHPSDSTAWMEIARVHESLGETVIAAEDSLRAVRLMPHPEPDAIVECADRLRQAGRDDEALALLDRAPLLPATVERAIAIELAHARHESALRRIDAWIAVTKVREPLLARRASILAQSGRHAEAISAWEHLSERIGSLPPESRESQAMLTLANQCRQAIESLKQTSESR